MGLFDNFTKNKYKNADEITEKDKIILNFLNLIQLTYGIDQIQLSDDNLKYKLHEINNAKFDWTIKSYEYLNKLNLNKIFVELVDFSNNRSLNDNICYYAKRSRIFMALIGYCNIVGIESNKDMVDNPYIKKFDNEMRQSYEKINIGIQGLFEYQHKFKFKNLDVYSRFYLEGFKDIFNYKENIPFLATDPKLSMYLYAYYTTKDGSSSFLKSISHLICWIYNIYKIMFSIQIALIAALKMFITISSDTINDKIAKDLANDIPYIATLDRLGLKFSITALNNDPNAYTYVGINEKERNIIF